MSEHRDCTGKNCTCGIGPWSSAGVCDHCGGVDLGVAWLPFGLAGHSHDPSVPEPESQIVPDHAEERARLIERVRGDVSDQETQPFEGKSCTCGVGPWSGATGGYEGGRCANCGGTLIWAKGFGSPVHPATLPSPAPVFWTEDAIRKIAREEATKVIERLIDYAERRERRG